MLTCGDTPFCRRKACINISTGFWSRVILAITKPAARRSHSGPHIHVARRVALHERNEVRRALHGRQSQVAPLDWQFGALACVFMRLFQSPNRFCHNPPQIIHGSPRVLAKDAVGVHGCGNN
jgi:hypothetical protein